MIDKLEIDITLRCNQRCINCSRLCNMPDTGIIFDKRSDMTLEQIHRFIQQVQEKSKKYCPVINRLTIIGGEPLLHPQIVDISKKIYDELVKPKLVCYFRLITNKTIPIPNILNSFFTSIEQGIPLSQKHRHHICYFVNCYDFGYRGRPKICKIYNQCGMGLSVNGYSSCIGGEGVARIFQLNDFFIHTLPESHRDFPKPLEDLCRFCPWMFLEIYPKNIPYEKDFGRLISPSFRKQFHYNKSHPPFLKIF